MFRKENGVTLVALVITIIVLLILAGVTISMVLGDDGIIAQASDATLAQVKGDVKDAVNLALAAMRSEDVAIAAGVSNLSKADADAISDKTTKPGARLADLLEDAKLKVTSETDTSVTLEISNNNRVTSVTVTVEGEYGENYSATYTALNNSTPISF